MRGLDRLALAPSSEAREDASRGDPQPAETCRRPLAPAPPCSCGRAPPTRQRGSDRPVLALSSTAPPPKSCSVSLPSLVRMRTALSVPRCGLGAHTRLATTVDLELFYTDCAHKASVPLKFAPAWCVSLLTLGAHAQRGLRYLPVCVCVFVCYRSSSYSVRFNLQPTASVALL